MHLFLETNHISFTKARKGHSTMENVQYTNGDFQYAFISEEAIEILRYTGNDSKLNVPESLDFLPVARIGDEALKGCSSLTNVVICEGIQHIGTRAFSGCCSLASINIPASVVSIADSAFEGCSASLVFVVQPNSAGHRWAIANHQHIDTFSSSFLYGFYNQWPERAVVEKYVGDGGNVVLPHELDGYPVVCVWERAFRGCQSLTGIVFPEGLEDIAEEAFCCCGSLICVILPTGLKCIGSWAFSECKSLSRVVIPASVTTIGVDAFAGCADDLTLIVEKDSYAHHWAEEMRYPYLYPDDGD